MTSKKEWLKIKANPLLKEKANKKTREWQQRVGRFRKTHNKKCPKCNGDFATSKPRQIYCSPKCCTNTFTGKKHPRWKGGKYKDDKGYIVITVYNHPKYKNKRVYEHRLIIENHIGRYLLPGEIIHHKNYNPSDNHIDNLMLFKHSGEHMKFHWEESKRLYFENIELKYSIGRMKGEKR